MSVRVSSLTRNSVQVCCEENVSLILLDAKSFLYSLLSFFNVVFKTQHLGKFVQALHEVLVLRLIVLDDVLNLEDVVF